MADLAAVTIFHVVKAVEQETRPAAVALTLGQYVFVDSNGKWAIGNSTDQAHTGRRAAIVVRSVDAGFPVTGIIKGWVDVGNILSALAFDAQVFLSDTTGGLLGTAAGTVNKVVGTVTSAWGNTTADKLLFLDL